MSAPKKVTAIDILSMKGKEKISALTCYDYTTSILCDKTGIDVLLVGDSVGMVVLGYKNTTSVQMEEMTIFCAAVRRGASRAMVVGDMPFGSYQSSPSVATDNAVRLIRAGCDAVKLEGGIEMSPTIKHIVDGGIPVMGHIGLKPQTALLWDGYRVQGKTSTSIKKLLADAKALEQAGVFCIVLEMVVSEAAEIISKAVSVPTIGIGSGPACDGQVLVLHDILGLYEGLRPRFAKRYAELNTTIAEAVSRFSSDIKTGKFPDESYTFHLHPEEAIRVSKEFQ